MKTFTLGALLFAFPAFATTVVALDLPALSRSSDAIVQGRVAKVEAKMSKDGGRITTHVTVDVSDTLKGEPTNTTIEIVQPGGVVGDVGQKVAGTTRFQVGDEIVTFLERRSGKRFMLTGMAQGCFRVERSSDGQSAFAVQDAQGDLTMLDPVTHAPVHKGTPPMKLDELKAKVRALLAPPVAKEPTSPTGPVQRESMQ